MSNSAPQGSGSAEQPAVTEIALGARPLPQTISDIEDAIGRAAGGELLDLTTEHDVIVKYVVPTAAVRGVKSSFRRDAELGWRIALRPRTAGAAKSE
ncbi:MAG: hypothetical protein O2822_03775 [Chloroflexi bacterium]|nr:hypothetical protein [Chloroflexota bacterium]